VYSPLFLKVAAKPVLFQQARGHQFSTLLTVVV